MDSGMLIELAFSYQTLVLLLGSFLLGLSSQRFAGFNASPWLVAREPFQIVSTSCLFFITEELLLGFCKSHLGVLIVIISGEFNVSLFARQLLPKLSSFIH